MSEKILRIRQLREIVPLSTATIYRLMREGKFPRRRQLTGDGAVGWLLSDIEAWMQSRPDGKSVSSGLDGEI